MATCNSIEGKYRCSIKENEYEIIADATPDKGGEGLGFRPHTILESAYASCLNMFVQMLCDKMRLSSEGISVQVNLTRLEDKTIFNYSINFGSDISQKQKEKILKAVEECPVRKTLSKPIEFCLVKD